MKTSFESVSKFFFQAAGLLTTAAALPMALAPVGGLRVVTGLTYFDASPQLFPIVGHWGVMVAGLGVLMFLAATYKPLRKAAALFATLEKGYLVALAAYCFAVHAPYARNYLIVILADGSMTLGGLWYLVQSRRLGQA